MQFSQKLWLYTKNTMAYQHISLKQWLYIINTWRYIIKHICNDVSEILTLFEIFVIKYHGGKNIFSTLQLLTMKWKIAKIFVVLYKYLQKMSIWRKYCFDIKCYNNIPIFLVQWLHTRNIYNEILMQQGYWHLKYFQRKTNIARILIILQKYMQ